MAKAWQKLDLEGGGLQAVNASLARNMKSRPQAYWRWAAFPLGLHRFYLEDPKGGSGYILLSLLTLGIAWLLPTLLWWLLPAMGLLGWAAYDLLWIDRRVVAYNKQLRVQMFLRKGSKPPSHYRGRYTDDDTQAAAAPSSQADIAAYSALKEAERAGHPPTQEPAPGAGAPMNPKRLPSFNEQEALLRELTRKRASSAAAVHGEGQGQGQGQDQDQGQGQEQVSHGDTESTEKVKR